MSRSEIRRPLRRRPMSARFARRSATACRAVAFSSLCNTRSGSSPNRGLDWEALLAGMMGIWIGWRWLSLVVLREPDNVHFTLGQVRGASQLVATIDAPWISSAGTTESSPALECWVAGGGIKKSRQGRKKRDGARFLSSLSGLGSLPDADPALKCWAIVFRPLGWNGEPGHAYELRCVFHGPTWRGETELFAVASGMDCGGVVRVCPQRTAWRVDAQAARWGQTRPTLNACRTVAGAGAA